ncbi:MAG: PH domain-containing protein [Propionibacteriaceae bacterium]|jgi:hypothetical protein|nr:PH domain-containing protein [Propionibacteriaceae bacterium]
MIDFNNASYLKLAPSDPVQAAQKLQALLLHNEQVVLAFTGLRDSVVFTNLRIIAVNVQGITGKKVDYTSLPLNKIQAFSVETAGTFDLDSELELWFSGLGKVKLEFTRGTDIKAIGQLIGQWVFR